MRYNSRQNHRPKALVRIVPIIAMVMLATACGGDDSGDASSTTSSTAGSTAEGATTSSSTSAATTTPTTTPTTTQTSTTTTEPPPSTLPPSKPSLTTIGLGGVIVGMIVEEAEKASGYELKGKLDPEVSDVCYFVEPTKASGLTSVAFMVYEDKIARVDVFSPSDTTTRSGAGVGLDIDLLYELFPGQIEETPGFTVDGEALAYVPQDEKDKDYRIVFDVEEGRVSYVRAGILPMVGFGEGCL